MEIIETPTFTRQVTEILTDDEYRELQFALVNNPEIGPVIQGSGGLRKVRWALRGRGKRSGVRTIYYWATCEDQIVMLLIYPKNEQDELSSRQVKVLRKIIEEEYP